MLCSIVRRVSTESQAAENKISLKEQYRVCFESIQARGWTLARDFNFEHTHGAEMRAHPLYAELKQHLQKNECDVLITAVLDRTLRDTGFWQDLSEVLQQTGKLLATPGQIYDPRNLEQELFLNISSSIGQFERKKIKSRAEMGLRALKDAGGWTGGTAPYGYRFNPATRQLEIDPAESQTLATIFDLVIRFTKVHTCQRINATGARSRTNEPWTPRMLRRLLERPRLRHYAGLRLNSRGDEIPATWPALITQQQYILLLQKKTIRTTTWSTSPSHMLTGLGIFKCGFCGLSIKTAANRSRERAKVYYYCSGYARGRDFCQNSRAKQIEKINTIILKDIIHRVQNIEIIRQGMQAAQNDNRKTARMLEISKRIQTLNAGKKKLINAVENDLLQYEEIAPRLQEIRQEISLLEAEHAELNRVGEKPYEIGNLYALAREIQHLPDYPLDRQREIISLLVSQITLWDKGLEIQYRFPIAIDGSREVRHSVR